MTNDFIWSSATVLTTTASLLSANITTPFLGVPLQVIFVAFLGSLIAMGLSDPVKPRGKMFALLTATTFIGTLLVSVLPYAPMLGWTDKIPEAVLGGVCSFALQWTLLPAVNAGRRFLDSYKIGGQK